MPRKRAPTHLYSVSVSFFLDEHAKERFERRESIQIMTELVYNGTSERQAIASLYRTARAAMTNPLAYAVLMEQDGKVVVRARIEHH